MTLKVILSTYIRLNHNIFCVYPQVHCSSEDLLLFIFFESIWLLERRYLHQLQAMFVLIFSTYYRVFAINRGVFPPGREKNTIHTYTC